MKALIVEVIRGEIWLKCQDHGLVHCFGGPYVDLVDLTAKENEHATVHLHAALDLA